MTPEAFAIAVRGILGTEAVLTLATCAPGSPCGAPWATDVYFAPDGYDLVFFSSPGSRHCRNLAQSGTCAATVHPPAASWKDIRGLQMEGEAFPIRSAQAKVLATAAYLGKFPFARELMANPAETARRMTKVSAHIFRPARIRYLDNSLGFGTRYAVLLKDGAFAGPPVREESAEAFEDTGAAKRSDLLEVISG